MLFYIVSRCNTAILIFHRHFGNIQKQSKQEMAGAFFIVRLIVQGCRYYMEAVQACIVQNSTKVSVMDSLEL